MISEKIQKLLLKDVSSFILPASDTSMVFADNTLMHASMILNNVNYASIPVLDYDKKFIGLISNHVIMKHLQNLNLFNFEELNNYKVIDALDKRFYIVYEDFSLEEVLNALVNYNFICITDKEGYFKGIITRSSVLKRINYLVHNLEDFYDLVEKSE